jgi:hypothetical protein
MKWSASVRKSRKTYLVDWFLHVEMLRVGRYLCPRLWRTRRTRTTKGTCMRCPADWFQLQVRTMPALMLLVPLNWQPIQRWVSWWCVRILTHVVMNLSLLPRRSDICGSSSDSRAADGYRRGGSNNGTVRPSRVQQRRKPLYWAYIVLTLRMSDRQCT